MQEALKREQAMIDAGVEIFHARNKRAEQTGQVQATSYAKRLTPESLNAMIQEYPAFKKRHVHGRHSSYCKLYSEIETPLFCHIVLQNLLGALLNPISVQGVAVNIGREVELECRIRKFKAQHEDTYRSIIKDLARRKVKNKRHLMAVFGMNTNNHIVWNPWSLREKAGVGMIGIKLAIQSTELFKIKRVNRFLYVHPTEECADWISRHKEVASLLHPRFLPSIVPLLEWDEAHAGGYHDTRLRGSMDFVKCRTDRQRDMLSEAIMPNVYSAVNALQDTAWEINTEVYEVFKEVWIKGLGCGLPSIEPLQLPPCPVPKDLPKEEMSQEQQELFSNWKYEASLIYTEDKKRVSAGFGVVAIHNIVAKYKDAPMYFPYQLDFRSRVYAACPILNPQGQDHSRALIRFREGKPITKEGEKWFLLHGANSYGYDKLEESAKLTKIKALHQNILDVADDPISNREFWANADTPWRFLAWCFEYKQYSIHGVEAVSKIPIALDGTCNGLQHYSALLRDEVGGAAVNLVPSETPKDIYAEVAKVLAAKLEVQKAAGCKMADTWLRFGITRHLCKRPVMTLPYGSTRRSCVDSIYQYVRTHKNKGMFTSDFHAHNKYLSDLLWESIGEVVIAARACMAWLREVSKIILKKHNSYIKWESPIGFPVIQDERVKDELEVISALDNKRRSFTLRKNTDKIHKVKMNQGISPNFIHSLDASHMMMCINSAKAQGINSFACIHDDYGVHAADTAKFNKIIREEFVRLHTQDILERFKEEQEKRYDIKLPELPNKGTLDINSVLDSKYFFS